MPPTDFGFDPTIQLYQENMSPIPSYLISNTDVNRGYESLHWVFSMPTEDNLGREDFVTIRSLSVNRSEVVRGRATRLWLVCKLEDLVNLGLSVIQVSLGGISFVSGSLRFPFPVLCSEGHVAGH